MFCTNCGTKLQDNAAFCTKCGARVVPNQAPARQASPQQAYSAPQPQPQPQYVPPQQGPSPLDAVTAKLSSVDVSKLTDTLGNSRYLGIAGIASAAVVCVTMFLRWVCIPCSEIASTLNNLLGDYGVFLPYIQDIDFSLLSISDSLHNVDGLMGLLSLLDSYDYQVTQVLSSISAYKTLFDVFIILGILSLIFVIVGVSISRFESKETTIALIGFVACPVFSVVAIIVIGQINTSILNYFWESVDAESLSYSVGPDVFRQLKNLQIVKCTIAPILCAVFSALGAVASYLTMRKAR